METPKPFHAWLDDVLDYPYWEYECAVDWPDKDEFETFRTGREFIAAVAKAVEEGRPLGVLHYDHYLTPQRTGITGLDCLFHTLDEIDEAMANPDSKIRFHPYFQLCTHSGSIEAKSDFWKYKDKMMAEMETKHGKEFWKTRQ